MQLSKEEYARKRIHNGFSVQIENSVTRVTVRHYNSYPRDGIFNQHLKTIKDSYNLTRPYPTRGVDKKRIRTRVVNTLVVQEVT